LPFAVAVGLFGVSFGVLALSAGMGSVAPIVMSVTTFAGSAQFAAVSVLGSGGSAAAAVAAAVLLNTRYAPMGLAASDALHGGRLRRALEAQLVVDEAWALAGSKEPGHFDRGILLGAGALLYAAWVVGTVVGVVAGEALGDPESLGLDAAFPALFLALLVVQLRSRTAWAAAALGGLIALVLVPLTPPGVPIIASVLGVLVGLRR